MPNFECAVCSFHFWVMSWASEIKHPNTWELCIFGDNVKRKTVECYKNNCLMEEKLSHVWKLTNFTGTLQLLWDDNEFVSLISKYGRKVYSETNVL